MSRIDDLLVAALRGLPPKPNDQAAQTQKKRYSELVSQAVALAIAEDLRLRGLKEARPASPGELGGSGAERRMAGGLGAKKVDVTWATEEAGLLLAISIKSINFKDVRTGNYQKNLVNRRGDMLMEAVTLHRRFPYAVLSAFFFLDKLVTKVNVLPEELRAHQVLGPASRWKVEDKDKRWAAVQAWATHPLIRIGDEKSPGSLEAGIHIDGFSNPGSNEIEWLFKTVGLGGIWDLFKSIEPDQIVVQSINIIVNRRNQIAHGKADATITLGDELIYVERAERIAEVFEQIVSQELNGRLQLADCWVELEKQLIAT
jgi:RiboL-PSP-HEPN